MNLKTLGNTLTSAYHLLKFFTLKKHCKLVYFKVPTSVLFSYLDYSIINTVSERIDFASILDLDNTPGQFDNDMYLDNYGTNQVKHLIKLGWLIKDLKVNKIKNPIQLIRCKDKYFVHPGTDRIIVATYIHPVEHIEGFYVWYPCIDPEPFILDYDWQEITSPLSFIKKFKFSKSFTFRSATLTDNLDVSDGSGCTVMNVAQKCFKKTTKNYKCLYLTYNDKMQLDNMYKLNLKDVISFQNSDTCEFGGVTFKNTNGKWVKND